MVPPYAANPSSAPDKEAVTPPRCAGLLLVILVNEGVAGVELVQELAERLDAGGAIAELQEEELVSRQNYYKREPT